MTDDRQSAIGNRQSVLWRVVRSPWAILLPACVCVALTLSVWVCNLRAAYPLEYRESAMYLTTGALVEGRNPYAVSERPVRVNTLGIVYHGICYPFAWLAGNGYRAPRALSCVAVALSAWLLAAWARRRGCGWAAALALGVVLLTDLGFDVSANGRPDAVGLLFFLLSLLIPWRRGFSPASLAAAGALSLVGFYTKQYFLLGMPLVCSYVFLFVSKRRALTAGLLWLAAFAAAAPLAAWLLPCYFADVFYAIGGDIARDPRHLALHASRFALLHAPLLAALAAAGLLAWRRRAGGCSLQWRDWGRGLCGRALWDLPGHALAAGGLLVLWMGLHPGQGLLYYRQLVLPFLLLAMAPLLGSDAQPARRAAWAGALALQLLLIGLYGVSKAPRFWADHAADWRAVAETVAPFDNVCHDPTLVHILEQQGKPLYDGGHTYMAFFVQPGARPGLPAGYGEACRRHLEGMRSALRTRAFDAVVISALNDDFVGFERYGLRDNYRLARRLPVPLPYNSTALKLNVWVRK